MIRLVSVGIIGTLGMNANNYVEERIAKRGKGETPMEWINLFITKYSKPKYFDYHFQFLSGLYIVLFFVVIYKLKFAKKKSQ